MSDRAVAGSAYHTVAQLKVAALQRLRQGADPEVVAGEHGVSSLTLRRWLREAEEPESSAAVEPSSIAALTTQPVPGGAHEGRARSGSAARFDRFEVLGEGAMGTVHRAWDAQYGCEVALKTVRLSRSVSLERFKSEFRRASELSHPNLVVMYDLVVEGSMPCISMELVEGVALSVAQPMDPARVEGIAAQLFAGLKCLHDHDVIHRDIKPGNVLIERLGRVVIVDFGLAVLVDQTDPTRGGTLPYMAPELFREHLEITGAVDVYAAGVLLLELLLGRAWAPEFGGQPVPEHWIAELGRGDLQDVVRACLSTDVQARPLAETVLARLPGHKAHLSRLRPRAGFVGRETEIAWLQARLRPGAMLRVEGEASIGKSALLTQVLGRRPAISGRCHPAETVPFNGFDRAMDVLARRLPVDSEQRSVLATAFPVFRGRRRRRSASPMIEELANAVAKAMDESGMEVLWIDDAQWLDRDSLRLLRALAERSSRAAIVVTHRPLTEDHLLGVELWFAEAEVCSLGPLDAAAAADLAAKLVDDDAEGLLAEVGPFPFRLVQFAPHWKAGQRVEPTLEHLVRSDLADEPAAMQILELAAVHGGPIPVRVLASVFLDRRFPRALALLTRFQRTLVHHSTEDVSFAHDATQEMLRSNLDEDTRRAHHALLARAFQLQDPEDPGSAARHFAEAGNLREATAPALEAAARAESVFAWSRAADFYGLVAGHADFDEGCRRAYARALSWSGSARQAAEQHLILGTLEDRRRAAELLVSSGAFEEGDRVLREVLADHGLSLPDPTLRSVGRIATWALRASLSSWKPPRRPRRHLQPMADALWTVTGALGQFDPVRALAVHGQHVVLAKRSGDVGRLVRAAALDASYRNVDPSMPEAERIDQVIDGLLEGCDDSDLHAWVHVSRGYRAFNTSRFARALQHFERAEQLYLTTRTVRWERTLGWTNRVFCLGHLGRHEEMRQEYRTLKRRFEELGDRGASLAILEVGAGALVALAQDDPQLAVERLDHSVALLPDPAPATFAFLDLFGRVQVDLYQGDRARARARVREAWSSMRALRFFRMPGHVLAWMRVVTDPTRRNVRWAARQLARDASPWSRTAAAEVGLLRLSERRLRKELPAAEQVARDADLQDAADAFRLRLARAAGDDVQGLLDGVRARGIREPERFLRLWGAE